MTLPFFFSGSQTFAYTRLTEGFVATQNADLIDLGWGPRKSISSLLSGAAAAAAAGPELTL